MTHRRMHSVSSTKRQIVWFGVVGAHAAAVNLVILMLCVKLLGLHPLVANILAFLIAYQISFWGHRWLTFRDQPSRPRVGQRFFGVAVLRFILNEGIFALFLLACNLNYLLALILTLLIVPPITFISSKLWAFK